MSEPKPLSDVDVVSYAKYHAERASDGGASAEFYARAETFLRAQAAKLADMEKSLEDVRADRDAALAELVGMRERLADLAVALENVRKELGDADTLAAALRGLSDAQRKRADVAERERDEYREQMLSEGGKFLKEMQRADRLKDELAALQRLPEQEWANVCSVLSQGLALHARQDQPMAKAMLDAIDRGKTYVDRLLARLKPTGKVAEDERCVRLVLDDVKPHPDDIGTPLSDADSALSRLAAKAQGYEAAVADNAEQHRIMDAVWRKVAAVHYGGLGLKEALDATHPGTALLEEHAREAQQAFMSGVSITSAKLLDEHRKEVEALKQALESQQAECHTLRRAFLHERHRAEAAGAPPEHAYNARWAENLVADEHKALVRARNEGREQIASWLGKQWGEYELAERARALKEPEQ